MQIKVLLFASLGDLAGQRRLTLSLEGNSATVADLRDALGRRQPTLREALAAAIAAVNEEYATDAEELNPGDTVAFFPPVSGGGDYPEVYRLAKEAMTTMRWSQPSRCRKRARFVSLAAWSAVKPDAARRPRRRRCWNTKPTSPWPLTACGR